MDLQDAAVLVLLAILFVWHLLGKTKNWSDAAETHGNVISFAELLLAEHKDELLLCDCLDVSLPYPPSLLSKQSVDPFYLPLAPWAGAESRGQASLRSPSRTSLSSASGANEAADALPRRRDDTANAPPEEPDLLTIVAALVSQPAPQPVLASPAPDPPPARGPDPAPLPLEPICDPDQPTGRDQHLPALLEPTASSTANPSSNSSSTAAADVSDSVVARRSSVEVEGRQPLPKLRAASPRTSSTGRTPPSPRGSGSGRTPASPRVSGSGGFAPLNPQATNGSCGSGRTTPRSSSPRVSGSGWVPTRASAGGGAAAGGSSSSAKPPRSPASALKAGLPPTPQLRSPPPSQQSQPPPLMLTPGRLLASLPASPQMPLTSRQHRYGAPKLTEVQPVGAQATEVVQEQQRVEEVLVQHRTPSTSRSRELQSDRVQSAARSEVSSSPIPYSTVTPLKQTPGQRATTLKPSRGGSPSSSVLRRAAEFEGLCRSAGGGATGALSPPTPSWSARSNSSGGVGGVTRRSLQFSSPSASLSAGGALSASASFKSSVSSATVLTACCTASATSSASLLSASSSELESGSNRSSLSSLLSSDEGCSSGDGTSSGGSERNSSSGDGNSSSGEDEGAKGNDGVIRDGSSKADAVIGNGGGNANSLATSVDMRSSSSNGDVASDGVRTRGGNGGGKRSTYSSGGDVHGGRVGSSGSSVCGMYSACWTSGGDAPLVRTSTRLFTSAGGVRSSGGGVSSAGPGKGPLSSSTASISFLAFARATQMEAAAADPAAVPPASPTRAAAGTAVGMALPKTASPPIGKRLAKPNMPRIAGL